MRDIVEFIDSTLSGIIPVAFQEYPKGDKPLPNQYATFLEYTSNPELEAGDVELERKRLIQMNVWSRGNYHSIVEIVRKKMEDAEFEYIGGFDAPYTDGDSHYNKVLRFAFFDEY